MKLIATIENEPITLGDDGIIRYRAKAAIDGDGVGSPHGDPDYQNANTLRHNGHFLNADTDQYIAVPPAIIAGVGPIVLGSQVRLLNSINGKTCDAVVADIGPHRKLGEISIAAAAMLGIDPSPTRGGEERHVVFYEIHPGVPAVVRGETYELQPSSAH